MKIFIITTLLTISSFANATECKKMSEEKSADEVQDVNSSVPKGLEGSVIIVRTKDGKESSVPIEKFKVVPRAQQFKVTKTKVTEKMLCEVDVLPDKNMVMVGARRDHVNLESSVSNDKKSATISSKKDIVVDAAYMRTRVLGPVGAGVGIDTNGVVKGILGVEF